ncbi:MAG: DUF1987 domain-containing protein [Bacteroidales bacterium]|nr:MAG: DUF1987 domain-containing protein [Bacteroidales bacterium]
MESLFISATSKTPSIVFDREKKVIEIKGKSTPEDHVAFYSPILDWFDSFILDPPDYTQVNVHLDYFNTSSSKVLLKIFKKLELINEVEKKVEVNWYYEIGDWDMKDCGLDYEAIVNVPFRLIEVPE